jgi:hypothetical protein
MYIYIYICMDLSENRLHQNPVAQDPFPYQTALLSETPAWTAGGGEFVEPEAADGWRGQRNPEPEWGCLLKRDSGETL